jgi:hypothetical protein
LTRDLALTLRTLQFPLHYTLSILLALTNNLTPGDNNSHHIIGTLRAWLPHTYTHTSYHHTPIRLRFIIQCRQVLALAGHK